MPTLPTKWKAMAVFTPKELAELTRQYIALHYPDWKKTRYSVSVRWSSSRSYIWVFNFRQHPEDETLIRELGFNLSSWGGMEDNLRILLDAAPVFIAYDRKSIVIRPLSDTTTLPKFHIPTISL